MCLLSMKRTRTIPENTLFIEKELFISMRGWSRFQPVEVGKSLKGRQQIFSGHMGALWI